MTLEQAKKRLAEIEGRKDPLSQAFIGGRVGFRKDRKKVERELDRFFKEVHECARLREFIKREEDKLKPKVVKPSRYYESVDQIEKGGQYVDECYGLITVVRINKNTVTIQTPSGYTETRKPHFIYKKAA